MTPLWITDIPILYEKKYLFEIIPLKDFDFNRKLNAILRFTIYYAVLVYVLYKQDPNVFFIPFVAGIISYVLNNRFKQTMIENAKVELFNNVGDDSTKEKSIEDLKEGCRVPTKNNPFMNPAVTDYGKPTKEGCSSYANKGIQQNIEKHFSKGLYRDVTDIFGKGNSQRQFFSVPGRDIRHDQGGFAKWLYGTPPTCKEGNGLQCGANQMGVPKGPGSDEVQFIG